jgi:DNA-binding MarR family transcriptional regulator
MVDRRIRFGQMQPMTTTDSPRKNRSGHLHAGVAELLQAHGLGPAASEALLDIDGELFHFHRRSANGDWLGAIAESIGLKLELAQFQGLTAVARIVFGIGRPAQDATIGLVAEEMALDPSRASRIVAELVAQGYVLRAAAQDDGRKSVLALTALGRKAMADLRDAKWKLLLATFEGWSEDEITSFARLFGKYVEASHRVTAEARCLAQRTREHN